MAREMFRSKNFGNINFPSNSHSLEGNFYVDRSRLKTKDVEQQTAAKPGEPSKWKVTKQPESIMDNARRASGEMGYRTAYRNETDKADNCWGESRNPLTRKKGDS